MLTYGLFALSTSTSVSSQNVWSFLSIPLAALIVGIIYLVYLRELFFRGIITPGRRLVLLWTALSLFFFALYLLDARFPIVNYWICSFVALLISPWIEVLPISSLSRFGLAGASSTNAKCPNCGFPVAARTNYCPNCGHASETETKLYA